MKKYHIDINPAYQYALYVTISVLLNWSFGVEGNLLLVMVGLGFFIVIYILHKILKKLK